MHVCRGNYRGQWFNEGCYDDIAADVFGGIPADHPLADLAVSPQCGFASEVRGNPLTWDDQHRKLDLTVSVAQRVWGGV